MVGSNESTEPRAVRGQRAVMLETLLRKLPMVRLRAAAASVVAGTLAMALATGCTGSISDGDGTNDDDTETPEAAAARVAWERENGAYDAFMATCAGCHKTDPTYPYLAGDDVAAVRQTVLDFSPNPVVNLEAPSSSRVLIKGPHNGAPALGGAQSAAILDWIQKEQIAAGIENMEEPIRIEPFSVIVNQVNTVDLTPVGLPGASISFYVQPLSSMLYVTELQLNAGPDGAHVVHPLFTSYPADQTQDAKPDPLDRFFSTDIDLETGSVQLDGGAAGFSTFVPTDKIGISFVVAEAYQGGGDPPPAGGCKALASYVANVKPQFQNNCAGCHGGGNQNAKSALDLSLLGSDDEYTCAQTLNRISTEDIPNSAILLAPDPSVPSAHDFKFGSQGAYDTYEAAVTPWIEAERDAP